MGSATGGKAMWISPLATYPVALLLMAAQGWWRGNLEAMFAAPITALLFTLLDYPVAVIVLWIVYRQWPARPAPFRAAAAIGLALAAYLALIRPLDLFRFPAGFMAALACVTALAWGGLYARLRRQETYRP